jgi:3-deoxy-D-manno-octulosonic-acid transferase
MTLFFYNLALLVVLVAGSPWWLWRMATTHKYREGLGARLGIVPPSLLRLARERPILWLHAVSVGEVIAASRLIGALDRVFPGHQLVISTTTRTGQELARQRFGAHRVFYCPLDLPWAVRAYLRALQPRVLILAETEFWPNLLSDCFHRHIPVAVVNARISDRSWPRYRQLRALWKPILSHLSRVLAQSPTDAERLKAIGCAEERVSVSGNLKFDVRAAQEAVATRQLKALAPGLRFVVAGSTLEGEEAALLEAWPRLLAADPQLVLVLAPRHPERFGAVDALLGRSGVAWVKRSDWRSKPAGGPGALWENAGITSARDQVPSGWRAHDAAKSTQASAFEETDRGSGIFSQPLRPLRPGEIFLLDSIGELASIYSLAAVAFVGGSIVPAGGHNPLEPAQFGVPIVMGPHYANFRAITEDLRAHAAIRIAVIEALAATLIDLLSDSPSANAMGERARQVFDRQAGATDRCVNALKDLLLPGEITERPS